MTRKNPIPNPGWNLSRRQFLGLGGGLVAGITLAACSPGAAGSTPSTGGGATRELSIWANTGVAGDTTSGLHRSAAAFGKANNVNVTIQGLATSDLVPKLTTAVAGGSGPDVAIVDSSSVPQLAAAQVLADLSAHAKSVASQFYQGALEYSGYNGKQYGLPYTTNNVAFFYNKGMLDAAGVSVPKNWDDLRAAAIELTHGQQYGMMMGPNGYGAFLFWPYLWQNGGQILNKDLTAATFNDAAGMEAFKFYAGLAMTDKVAPPEFVAATGSWDAYLAPFIQGRVAMMPMGPWGIAPITAGNPNLDWAIAPLPTKKTAASVLGGTTIGVATHATNADLAWQFVEWATAGAQTSYIQDMGNIPGRKDVITSTWATSDPKRQVFVEQMAVAQARPEIPIWGAIEWGIFANAWDSVIQGKQSPADALNAAATQSTQKLSS